MIQQLLAGIIVLFSFFSGQNLGTPSQVQLSDTVNTLRNTVNELVTNYVASSSLVTGITGSTYLGASAPTGNVTLTNNGVQSVTAGTGISLSSATGTVTITNTNSSGISSINGNSSSSQTITGGTGISVSSSLGTSTITNTGVTSIVAASSTLISNATGTVTIGSRARKADFTLVFTSSTNTYDDYLTTFDTTSTLKKIYIWTLLGQYATTTGSTVTLNFAWDGVNRTATAPTSSAWRATSTDVVLTTSATISNFASSSIPAGTPFRMYSYNASSTEVGITIMYDEN